MTLIADSGSTKTAWELTSLSADFREISYQTSGLNPYLLSVEQLQEEVSKQLPLRANDVSEVFFYGAGCADASRCQQVRTALQPLFLGAKIYVESDLLGAARAVCRRERGIICILGTGANSALFDGEQFVDQILPLGYQLGDEGGGADLGRRLLQAYFYRELPPHLQDEMRTLLPNGRTDVLDAMKGKRPNTWLANWTHFIHLHIKEPTMNRLVSAAFEAFLTRQISKYADCEVLPIHFVGSVATTFEPLLTEVLAKKNLQKGSVTNTIIKQLSAYHRGSSAV